MRVMSGRLEGIVFSVMMMMMMMMMIMIIIIIIIIIIIKETRKSEHLWPS